MNIKHSNYDVVIIGGGPAGLYAAYNASLNGAKSILVIERDRELGGILQQCIHNGFGLQLFKKELTGPSYAQQCYNLVKDIDQIEFLVDTMVIDIHQDKTVVACGADSGFMYIKAKAIILAMGCRERTRGAIKIAGSRPSGVFTAGSAQRMVNMEGVLPGNTAVILGSGDIGLIMARRLSLEGVKVLACIELSPYSNGLTRNIVQCLNDYDIPLYLSHTISQIHGEDRVTGVTIVKVDEKFKPIAETEFFLDCDTVLFSVGLIPENELSKQINIPLHPLTNGPIVDQNRLCQVDGIFAAGNVLHVHDLADFASMEAAIAGKSAAMYVKGELPKTQKTIPVVAADGLRTIVPQLLSLNTERKQDIELFIRPSQPQDNVKLEIISNDNVIASQNIIAARPSEMIVAKIKASDIDKIQNNLTLKLTRR